MAIDNTPGSQRTDDARPTPARQRSGRGHGVRNLTARSRSAYEVRGPDGKRVGPKRRTQHLRSVPTIAAGAPADVLAAAHAAATQLESASLADATWNSYTSHWVGWETWCRANELAAMPALPEDVCAYLASLAVCLDDSGELMRDEQDRLLPGRLRPVSVGKTLAAINKFHEWANLPRPGDATQVRRVMAGIRRSFGVHSEDQKAALTLPLLTRLLDVTYEPDARALRDTAAVLLSQHRSLLPRRLAALDWRQIALTATTAVVLDVTATPIAIAAAKDPRICAVTVLNDLRAHLGGTGPVLPGLAPYDPARPAARCGLWQSTGKPLSRQGITKLLGRHLQTAGVDRDSNDIADLSPTQLRKIVTVLAQTPTTLIRDRALLLTGWVGALRRSNLSWLDWRDISPVDDEYDVLLRFQKNDQEGKGHTISLTRGQNPRTDPVAAYEAWRELVGREINGSPEALRSADAVFIAIDRHGNLQRTDAGAFRRLHPDSINSLVQRYVQAAGLAVSDFGAHSLRAGFITEAAEQEIPLHDIQAVSGHKSTEMVMRYIRTVDRRRRSPARRMGL